MALRARQPMVVAMTTGVMMRTRRPGRLVLPLVIAAAGFVGWIIALAVRLPDRYVAGHWNVAWVGFDVILLVSLVSTAWVFARREYLVPTAALVTAVLLLCDAWFDVTTASGLTDTTVSLVSAALVELPIAAVLVWAARRQLRRQLVREDTRRGR